MSNGTQRKIDKIEREKMTKETDKCKLCEHPRHAHTNIKGEPIRCVWGDCKCKGFKEKMTKKHDELCQKCGKPHIEHYSGDYCDRSFSKKYKAKKKYLPF